MSILRDLAALLLEAAKYLGAGTAYDRAWAEHMRNDALSVQQLAQADRHEYADEAPR